MSRTWDGYQQRAKKKGWDYVHGLGHRASPQSVSPPGGKTTSRLGAAVAVGKGRWSRDLGTKWSDLSRRVDDDLVTALLWLAGLVALVGILAAKNAHRTSGRACCAPADPRQDLRMPADSDEQIGRAKHF